jgi:hypothetical protein
MRELEGNVRLGEKKGFRERVEALERLEAFGIGLGQTGGAPHGEGDVEGAEEEIRRRAAQMYSELEAANAEYCERVREEIRRGVVPADFRGWAQGNDGEVETEAGDGYDEWDEMVSGILRFAEPGELGREEGQTEVRPYEKTQRREAEMVAYQPTPSRHIFDLLRRSRLGEGDVLLDVGSGLGHVALLAAICTRARSVGIEVEGEYVKCARQSAADLGLERVTFVEADARQADFSGGTVFYLYTPFRGEMLREVLERLRSEGARREIRVGTFGPCTEVVAREPWLREEGEVAEGRVAVFKVCGNWA